jgi:hypothetical protein
MKSDRIGSQNDHLLIDQLEEPGIEHWRIFPILLIIFTNI